MSKQLWIGLGVAAGVAALGGAAWWATQRKGTFTAQVRDFSDANWLNGVGKGQTVVWLETEEVKAGDTVLLPGPSGTEERKVWQAWPGDGSQVFLEGPLLNPSLVHGGMVLRVRKAGG